MLRIYQDRETGAFKASANSLEDVSLPWLHQGENPNVVYQLLNPTGILTSPYTVSTAAGIEINIRIGRATGAIGSPPAILETNLTWSQSDSAFIGNLFIDPEAVGDEIGDGYSATFIFQTRIRDHDLGEQQAFHNWITIRAEVEVLSSSSESSESSVSSASSLSTPSSQSSESSQSSGYPGVLHGSGFGDPNVNVDFQIIGTNSENGLPIYGNNVYGYYILAASWSPIANGYTVYNNYDYEIYYKQTNVNHPKGAYVQTQDGTPPGGTVS